MSVSKEDPEVNDEKTVGEESDDIQLLTTHNEKWNILVQEKIKRLNILLVFSGMIIILLACSFLNTDPPQPPKYDPPKYDPPQVWEEIYRCPDLTTLKGKYKEAYVFLYCSRNDPKVDVYYDMMSITIYKIQAMSKVPRDIVILTCPFTSFTKFETLRRLAGVILAPVETLAIPQFIFRNESRDSPTRLHGWKLIGWERVLMLDSDVYLWENWEDIWDEPVAQIRTAPPANSSYTLNSTYLGVKVQDLYPMAYAASIDHCDYRNSLAMDKINSGVSLFTPSLLHYKILIDAAYNVSYNFSELEQSVIDYTYRTKGALPFGRLDVIYNFWTLTNPPIDPKIKGKLLHIKLWQERWDGIEVIRDEYHQTQKDARTKTLLIETPHPDSRDLSVFFSEKVLVTSYKTNITLVIGQTWFDPNSTFYALATSDLFDRPSAERIIQASLSSNSTLNYSKGLYNMLTFNNLQPNSTYNIHYLNKWEQENKTTNIYHVQYFTTK
jgi:hypothetical protein